MGTFHDTKDPLHGVTVVVNIGDSVHVGRCHERDHETVVLLDVDSHSQNEDGKGSDGYTNAEYVAQAAKAGVWAKEKRLVLSAPDVESIAPLSHHYRRPGEPAEPAE